MWLQKTAKTASQVMLGLARESAYALLTNRDGRRELSVSVVML
jgi:hypothetical protein